MYLLGNVAGHNNLCVAIGLKGKRQDDVVCVGAHNRGGLAMLIRVLQCDGRNVVIG